MYITGNVSDSDDLLAYLRNAVSSDAIKTVNHVRSSHSFSYNSSNLLFC